MGIVLRFHSRASASLKPKISGAASLPSRARAAEKARKFSGGMAPRAFQLLTADIPTPDRAAVAAVPPRASIMASTELSMPTDSSRSVNVSRLHKSAVDCLPDVGVNGGMAETAETIGKRLILTREALEIKAAELCRRIDCKPNRWSQYERGVRPLTLDIANRLCDEFGLSLDWIYRNDRQKLPEWLAAKIHPQKRPNRPKVSHRA